MDKKDKKKKKKERLDQAQKADKNQKPGALRRFFHRLAGGGTKKQVKEEACEKETKLQEGSVGNKVKYCSSEGFAPSNANGIAFPVPSNQPSTSSTPNIQLPARASNFSTFLPQQAVTKHHCNVKTNSPPAPVFPSFQSKKRQVQISQVVQPLLVPSDTAQHNVDKAPKIGDISVTSETLHNFDPKSGKISPDIVSPRSAISEPISSHNVLPSGETNYEEIKMIAAKRRHRDKKRAMPKKIISSSLKALDVEFSRISASIPLQNSPEQLIEKVASKTKEQSTEVTDTLRKKQKVELRSIEIQANSSVPSTTPPAKKSNDAHTAPWHRVDSASRNSTQLRSLRRRTGFNNESPLNVPKHDDDESQPKSRDGATKVIGSVVPSVTPRTENSSLTSSAGINSITLRQSRRDGAQTASTARPRARSEANRNSTEALYGNVTSHSRERPVGRVAPTVRVSSVDRRPLERVDQLTNDPIFPPTHPGEQSDNDLPVPEDVIQVEEALRDVIRVIDEPFRHNLIRQHTARLQQLNPTRRNARTDNFAQSRAAADQQRSSRPEASLNHHNFSWSTDSIAGMYLGQLDPSPAPPSPLLGNNDSSALLTPRYLSRNDSHRRTFPPPEPLSRPLSEPHGLASISGSLRHKLARVKEDLIRVPGVLLLDVRNGKIFVTLSADRRNLAEISRFMRDNDIRLNEYECGFLPGRYRRRTGAIHTPV